MSSLSVTIFLFGYLFKQGVLPINGWSVSIIGFWIASIGFSRMYLGHHSPADICGGTILGSLFAFVWLTYADQLDNFMTKDPNIPLFLVLVMIILMQIHPRSIDTPSYARSISVIGLSVGMVYGSWIHQSQSKPDHLVLFLAGLGQQLVAKLQESFLWAMMTPEMWKNSLRLSIGFFLLNVSFLFTLKSLHIILHFLFSMPGISDLITFLDRVGRNFEVPSFPPIEQPETIKLKQSKSQSVNISEKKKHRDDSAADLWSKFFASFGISYLLTYTTPALFVLLDKHFG